MPPHILEAREECLRKCLHIGVSALNAKATALDVVELVVREMENQPLFNAGKGSVLTTDGTVEMEASIMDGNTKNCGAVSGLSTVVSAISLARHVMEKTPHIYLAFDGAEAFAREQGIEIVDVSYFVTPENIERLRKAKEAKKVQVGLSNILENIVERLKEQYDVSYLFLKPVSKKEAPDYLDIIAHPMDLATIKEKVRRMEYKSSDEFRHDGWQISYNAHKYNDGRNPGIPPLADQLLEICDNLLDENRYALADAEAGIEYRDT